MYSIIFYKVVYSFDYVVLILSFVFVYEDEIIVVGMINGILSVKYWKFEVKKELFF